MPNSKNFAAIFLIFTVCILSACGSDTGLKGKVALDGSSTVFPISEAVAEEYLGVQPRVRVTVGVSGTGGGFKKFLAGETDINNASRPIKASELEQSLQDGIEFIEIPIAFDGLSIVVNNNNTWVDYLSIGELHKIWQPGSTVTLWSDVRAEWPAKEIHLYGPGTDSGTFDYFTETVNGKSGASRPDYTASEDDNALVRGISGDVNALGYFGYAYYASNMNKLKLVPVDGGAGPVSPTPESINSGEYNPLSRPIFIYVRSSALARTEVAEFTRFYINNAGALAEEVGYIMLPDWAYERALERIDQRVTGTAYGEDAHTQVSDMLANE